MANIITSLRIIFAIVMVLIVPFSAVFWIVYLLGGLSDFLDGFVARKWKQQSAMGAQLDSIADVFFATAIAIVVIKNIRLPVCLWFCVALTALLRVTAYIIGFYKYRTFSPLHTYANKVTGALIFVFPLLYILAGPTIAWIILCLAALLSSFEEAAINVKSKELNRDCKSIFKINSSLSGGP